MREFLRAIYLRSLLAFRKVWPYRGFVYRALVCFIIGLLALWINYRQNFDLRFQLRNKNSPSPKITVVEMTRNDWRYWEQSSAATLIKIKELGSLSDSYFWDTSSWKKVLNEILDHDPKAIGITFFFNPRLRVPRDSVFKNSKIFWASRIDQEGRIQYPTFSDDYQKNTSVITVPSENDGISRRFFTPFLPVPHMATQLAAEFTGQPISSIEYNGRLINYQGPKDSYQSVTFSEILTGNFDPQLFEDKIIIIGTKDIDPHILQTPLGQMSKAEWLANLVDSFINNRWPKRLSLFGYFFLLLFHLVLSIYILNRYPHSVAFIFLTWISISYVALSVWAFDEFDIWLPILAPLVQTLATFVVFMSYQLSIKDNENWRLEQEKINLYEVEQLKDNFISLFSHDLKTPIAKIQAICDRLISENSDSPLTADLQGLRRESQELHRYIQSILKITRVESKDFKIQKDSCDINELVNEVHTQLIPLLEAKGQKLVLDLEPIFLIEVDGNLVREVILNLIENAIQYSPPGSKIEVSTYEDEQNVYFRVKDQGPGMTKEDQKRIFEKFYRSESQLNKTKGTGLGLYLSKYFIELHGGSISLVSSQGRGTEITVNLPV